jgi:pyroglutamyl-peptidase
MGISTMRLLISGFEPFDGRDINTSQSAVAALREHHFPGIDFHTVLLPVERERGPARLLQAVRQIQPDTVICLGEAKGRMRISIERVAINLLDYTIPDNTGARLIDQPIDPEGPAAYFATIPVRAMLQTLVARGIPGELSLSAGAFLCNQVAYTLLHELSTSQITCRAGFIHLPLLPEQAAREPMPVPSLSLETITHGLAVIIEMLARDTSGTN